jgi:hypothetical protein
MQYVHATDEGKRRAVEAVEKTQKLRCIRFDLFLRTPDTIRSQFISYSRRSYPESVIAMGRRIN